MDEIKESTLEYLEKILHGININGVEENNTTVLDLIKEKRHLEDLYNQLLKDYDELQEENERLKKQLEYLRTDEYLNQVKWERNFNETMNKELNTRIEKAVVKLKEIKRNKQGVFTDKGFVPYEDIQFIDIIGDIVGDTNIKGR